ncbi:hypothetical protein [Sediminibacterium sp.]|uniref:hypothetical protein n=1 Tax=Sediminibacterium sp. TaxID=1917865 RepID=UPI0025F96041|nr:hypothetical protein [Sediminibacterium sp.]MBW0177569.1 hypothetical protein [Sediminibacterium sp.]
MAHSNNSVITGKFQGSLGKELVFRNWNGKTIVAKAPGRRKGEPTADQLKTQDSFLMGSRYAKAISSGANPELAEAYTAVLKPRQNLYSRALEDFMSAPKVVSINTRFYKGAEGDKIVIRAKDDFKVTGVSVEIYAADGTLLETGEAVSDIYDLDWTYTATQSNSLLAGTVIKAIATDIPNNEGILEAVL